MKYISPTSYSRLDGQRFIYYPLVSRVRVEMRGRAAYLGGVADTTLLTSTAQGVPPVAIAPAKVAQAPHDRMGVLPRDWFETRDAYGHVVWCHMLTRHVVSIRPTKTTAIAPVHDADAAASALPPNWFETRAADGSTVWRNVITTQAASVFTHAIRERVRLDCPLDFTLALDASVAP